MKDYASMSDFEINKSVADIAMNGTWHVKPSHPDNDTGGWLYGSNGIQTRELPDYCNNPADAWPIITENRIGIIPAPDAGKWKSAHRKVGEDDTPYHFTQSDNPLRAAMIVFLMIKEREND